MLVIVSKEAASKLDHSMFVVSGSYEDGYTYDESVFFMEGIQDEEWCEIGANSSYFFGFVQTEEITKFPSIDFRYDWKTLKLFTNDSYKVSLYLTDTEQLFVFQTKTEYIGKVFNDTKANGVMSLNTALQVCLGIN